jgi:hypothetical protein
MVSGKWANLYIDRDEVGQTFDSRTGGGKVAKAVLVFRMGHILEGNLEAALHVT